MLPDYLEYMYNNNKNSLLPEFYGCYSLALKGLLPWSKVKIYLIVMKNLTPNKDDFIRFDLKVYILYYYYYFNYRDLQ